MPKSMLGLFIFPFKVSMTGRAVATYKIDSPVQRIELNLPKGCYILKVGKVVRKVTVR